MSTKYATVCLGVLFLYKLLGISAFVGLACLPLSAPVSYWVTKLTYRKSQGQSCLQKVVPKTGPKPRTTGWEQSKSFSKISRSSRYVCLHLQCPINDTDQLNAYEKHIKAKIQHLRDIEQESVSMYATS
jgi:hypothetical protein